MLVDQTGLETGFLKVIDWGTGAKVEKGAFLSDL